MASLGEDKLTSAQRLRLESFAQAIQVCMLLGLRPGLAEGDPVGGITVVAERIEEWLKNADTGGTAFN